MKIYDIYITKNEIALMNVKREVSRPLGVINAIFFVAKRRRLIAEKIDKDKLELFILSKLYLVKMTYKTTTTIKKQLFFEKIRRGFSWLLLRGY